MWHSSSSFVKRYGKFQTVEIPKMFGNWQWSRKFACICFKRLFDIEVDCYTAIGVRSICVSSSAFGYAAKMLVFHSILFTEPKQPNVVAKTSRKRLQCEPRWYLDSHEAIFNVANHGGLGVTFRPDRNWRWISTWNKWCVVLYVVTLNRCGHWVVYTCVRRCSLSWVEL